jgi:hypothetical protein
MDMFARKTLHQLAAIATLGSMGATALADYDCFEQLFVPGTGTSFTQPCPSPGTQLVQAELTLVNNSQGRWSLRVRNQRALGTNPVWVTAFLFDEYGDEVPTCNIHPSEKLFPGTVTFSAEGDCFLGSNERPSSITIFGAED